MAAIQGRGGDPKKGYLMNLIEVIENYARG
jgi:hypothetical protein